MWCLHSPEGCVQSTYNTNAVQSLHLPEDHAVYTTPEDHAEST